MKTGGNLYENRFVMLTIQKFNEKNKIKETKIQSIGEIQCRVVNQIKNQTE